MLRLLLVDGPGPLAFTPADRILADAFTLDATRLLEELGLVWALEQHPPVTHEICSFMLDTTPVTINPPGTPPARTGKRAQDIEPQEQHWLPSLAAALGLTP